jgi:hypothetical protein
VAKKAGIASMRWPPTRRRPELDPFDLEGDLAADFFEDA